MSDDAQLWEAVRDLRKRLADLEAVEYAGHALTADYATDADTVDTLHAGATGATAHVLATGASGQAQIDGLLTLLSGMLFGATGSGARIVYIPRKEVVDGTATAVFSITTTNETGDADAGSYSLWILAEACHSASTTSTNVASMLAQYMFTRSQKDTGAGTTGFEAEIYQTSSAATDAATRDISGIALTTAEVSEYVVNVLFNVGLTGTGVVKPYVDCLVVMLWQTYTTPPVITAL